MKAAFALGSESALQRRLGSRLRVIAGAVVGFLVAGALTWFRSAPPPPINAAIVGVSSALSASVPVASISPPAPSAPVDLAELRRKEIEAHHAAIAQHMRDPGDPTWAPASEKSLREFLNKLPMHAKYRLRLVDCRTTTCVAELSFASHDLARKTWHSVLEATNPINCATAITLEDPKEGAKSYEVSVIYHCERSGPNPVQSKE